MPSRVFPSHLLCFILLMAVVSPVAGQITFDQDDPRTGSLRWPAGPFDDYLLVRASSLSASLPVWSRQEGDRVRDGGDWTLAVELNEEARFYRLRYPTRLLRELAPAPGERMVNVTRHPVVRFDGEVQPETVTIDSFGLSLNGARE